MTSTKSSRKDGVLYDPELVSNHPDINLSNPEELEAHIQVLDVRERLRARRRRAIRLFSIAFCVLVAGLLVGMGLMSQWGKSSVEQQAQQGTMSASGTRLPPPPADLASKCSPTALETQQGYLICEATCEVADCCSMPQGFALSCSVGNEMACSQYELYCTALQQSLPAPPASPEELKVSIDEACIGLDASVLSGSDCMALCRTAFCCFETAGCSDDTNCQTYLNCAAAFESQEQQQQSSGGNNNSPATSPDSTPGATPIHNTIDEKDSALKQQIDAICGSDIETVSPPGEDSCESLCAMSYCCFDHLCVPPSDLQCEDYSACYVLFADTANVNDDITSANLGDEIHEACNGLMNVNDAAKNEACNSICNPGACCFEDKLSCSNIDCAMYAECIILHPSFISVSKEEVTDACKNHNDARLQSDEATLCEQVCTLHVMQCCFHEHGECDEAVLLGDNSVYCDTYQACAVLGTDSSNLIQSHKEELETACNGGASTRSQCIQLCSSATCCYATRVEESCVNVDKSITCSDYEACDVLYG